MSISEGRIMQLALARLESLRGTLDAQIAQLKGDIRSSRTQSKGAPENEAISGNRGEISAAAAARPKRRMTIEQRNAISEKMKIRWAERKQVAGNGNTAVDPERLKPRLIKANRPAMMP
ncbi:MAG TPA: hypothetical protein VFC63_11325 [Blastocatellia bacterium]|nr:hypothetical protein [Blastocatellia bacterium]